MTPCDPTSTTTSASCKRRNSERVLHKEQVRRKNSYHVQSFHLHRKRAGKVCYCRMCRERMDFCPRFDIGHRKAILVKQSHSGIGDIVKEFQDRGTIDVHFQDIDHAGHRVPAQLDQENKIGLIGSPSSSQKGHQERAYSYNYTFT